jgi:hypothetical protein
MNEETLGLDDQAVNEAVSLALNPSEGRPFTYGNKTFHLQFLTGDGEDRLAALLMPRIKALALAGTTEYTQVMNAIADLLPQAVTIILSDYDPTVDEAWVRSQRGPRMRLTMYDLVAAQFKLNDLGKLLSSLLQSDAMLSVLGEPQA